jgi:two-component system OmpR family response regulator
MELRVLVVEDEENVSFVVQTSLRQAGYEVDALTSGADAFRAAVDGRRPDLIVLDVMLPDMDGYEVCRRLRAEGIDIPIIFLTARDAIGDRLRGLTTGGDDYLTKPFSVEELVARVQVILRRVGKTRATKVLKCGDLELNDDAHVVRSRGEPISLSPTEYKLLRFLMRNAGRAVTRPQILDHVWNYDFEGESTIVETFISSLRKKLAVAGANMIQTVRGVGYRLSE